jgi:GxxExxY protein
MSTDKFLYQALPYKIIRLAMEVHKKLDCGFLEKVYESYMMVILRRDGIASGYPT